MMRALLDGIGHHHHQLLHIAANRQAHALAAAPILDGILQQLGRDHTQLMLELDVAEHGGHAARHRLAHGVDALPLGGDVEIEA
jgi:hypothetical protein